MQIAIVTLHPTAPTPHFDVQGAPAPEHLSHSLASAILARLAANPVVSNLRAVAGLPAQSTLPHHAANRLAAKFREPNNW